MNILISNDDGYLSQGIALLARLAGEFANVRVVAPERDKSGTSNSLTLDKPLRIRTASNGFQFVNGTPTDCIHVGMHVLAQSDFKPDLVLSGVNHGANMGDDTVYSGTVAAATEAYLMGIPAVAFSLNSHRFDLFTETVEKAVWSVLSHIMQQPPTSPVLWNVNIPAVAVQDLRGIKVTRLGLRHHEQNVIESTDPRGAPIYWIGPAGEVRDNQADTDFAACDAGWISITPLQMDLTAHNQIDKLQAAWQDFRLQECP
ncbi:5'/3'-nucleotidase SurE [Kingella kingae]|uniref:5'/3'-nucleotidase SurE n=1 Tax=Kingella kingae TaxID=504 RepID=UPI00056FEFF6|nr:5'/3'-nucleotidase SurE [Kingella kingae]MDK4623693.1 5'/3'-nucleotidase SurE [Kingella kingae]MDK4650412.1 5'/3'-nucleotidase SurE [Kingella kingae]MDK4659365.1 5'/3'-nucleotidase SurE [Kingella kingae]MDK4667644.1 5'/3'-nucleotidase SurE [Kingella kingae]MDK4686776.1 5'/3'-nucleotidase SurE [Kingella kingae]